MVDGSFRRKSTRRRSWKAAWLIGVAFVVASLGSYQADAQDDPTFRSFSDEKVPTPQQLYQTLTALEGVELNFPELAQSLLKNMPAETKEKVLDLVKDIAKQRGVPQDSDSMQQAVREFQERMKDQPELQKELSDLIRSGMKDGPGGLQGSEGGGNQSRGDKRRNRQLQRLGSQFQPPQEMPNALEKSAKSIFDRMRKQRTAPEPDLDDLLDEEPSRETPEANPEPQDRKPAKKLNSMKSLHQRVNQLLLDAAENSLDDKQGKGDAGDSGLSAGSVSKLLNKLAEAAQEKLNDPGTRDRLANSLKNASSRAKKATKSGLWNRMVVGRSSFDPGIGSGVNGWTIAMGVGGLLILSILFFVFRSRITKTVAQYLGRRAADEPFSLQKVDSRSDLVRAVDRYLKYLFGRSSRWWHSRSIERQLVSATPHLQGEISDLIDSYEIARYAPRSVAVPGERLRQSEQTLKRLFEFEEAKRRLSEPAKESVEP